MLSWELSSSLFDKVADERSSWLRLLLEEVMAFIFIFILVFDFELGNDDTDDENDDNDDVVDVDDSI